MVFFFALLSIIIYLIPESVKFPHTFFYERTYSAKNYVYFLCVLASKICHTHPCCWLSSAGQTVMHLWPHSLHPARLHWFHLITFVLQNIWERCWSNRLHSWIWSETCCGLLRIQIWDFWVDVEGLTVSHGNFSPLLTAITDSLPV